MSSKKRARREMIEQMVQQQGALSVGALAEALDVSMQTIRRDLDKICERTDLRRRHGRIELSADQLNTPFDQRADTNPMGKRAIAAFAAERIPDGASLFLSIGSTPLSVAHALRRRKNLTVMTNNLSAAMTLSEELSNRIILPGGEVRLPDRDLIGTEAVEFFGRFRAQFAVFGVAGVALDGGLLEFHPAEIRVREQMRQNAATSLLVVDSSKFGRLAPAVGGVLSEVDSIICDRPPPPPFGDLTASVSDRIVFCEQEQAA